MKLHQLAAVGKYSRFVKSSALKPAVWPIVWVVWVVEDLANARERVGKVSTVSGGCIRTSMQKP